jgi:hypothetical protein
MKAPNALAFERGPVEFAPGPAEIIHANDFDFLKLTLQFSSDITPCEPTNAGNQNLHAREPVALIILFVGFPSTERLQQNERTRGNEKPVVSFVLPISSVATRV